MLSPSDSIFRADAGVFQASWGRSIEKTLADPWRNGLPLVAGFCQILHGGTRDEERGARKGWAKVGSESRPQGQTGEKVMGRK